MPTLVLATGFEHGISNTTSLIKGNAGARFADVLAGTPAVVTSTPRTGSYCLELSMSAASESIGWDTNTLGSAGSVLVVGFGLNFPTLPSQDCKIWEMITSDAVQDQAFWHRNSDHRLICNTSASLSTGTPRASTNALTAATWYWIDFRFTISGTSWTVDWAIDGVAQTQWTFTTGTTDTWVRFNFGAQFDAPTYTVRFDDLLISKTSGDYPLGAHDVLLLKPDTGATATEIGTANSMARFTGNATADATFNSANILTALSEVPPLIGASATGIAQRASSGTSAANIPMTSYTLQSGETISGLRLEVVGWSGTTTANNLGLRYYNGTAETIFFALADPNFDADTAAPGWVCEMATLADIDTQTELDALAVRIGYSTDISPLPGAHAIFAEVAIKEGAGTTPVSSSIATSWAVEQAVTSTVAESWKVRQEITKTVAQTWPVETSVSQSVAQSWAVRQAITKATAESWNVIGRITSSSVQTWNLRSVVTSSSAQTWAVKQAIAQTVAQSWKVRQALTQSVAELWNVLGLTAVTSSIAESWAVRASVAQTVAGSWRVRQAVTGTAATSWNVIGRITSSSTQSWAVRQAVAKTTAESWNVIGRITSSSAQSWAVKASLTQSVAESWSVRQAITGSVVSAWRVRAIIAIPVAQTWNVRASLTQSVAQAWAVKTSATQSVAETWKVRQAVNQSSAQLWNVGGLLTTVTKTQATSWNVIGRITSSSAQSWAVKTSATQSVAQSWKVRQALTQSVAESWRVRAPVTSSSAQTWNVRQSIAQTVAESWSVRQVATKTLVELWNVLATGSVTSSLAAVWKVRAFTGPTLAEAWNIRTPVAQSLSEAWSVRQGVSASTASSWRVRRSLTASYVAIWHIVGRITATCVASWRVLPESFYAGGPWTVELAAGGWAVEVDRSESGFELGARWTVGVEV